MDAYMETDSTGTGRLLSTGSRSDAAYRRKMRDSPRSAFWRRLCRLAGLGDDASVDKMHEAYPVVGRGTIQRLREGGDPRLSSLRKIADHLRMAPADLVADTPPPPPSSPREAGAPPPPPLPGFSDRREVSDSEWQMLQDLRAIDSDERDAIMRDTHDKAERFRRHVRAYLDRLNHKDGTRRT